MGESFEIIGSDKIGFILNGKHGNSSLITLENDYSDFINISREDYPSEKIVLFPWRDEFESVKSGFFQDISMGLVQLLSHPKNVSDESILYIFRYLFNKKNNVNILTVGWSHKQLFIYEDSFSYFLTDNNKFYFFDIHDLSNPKLIEWISKHDSRWEDVSISHDNSHQMDTIKIKIKNILSQIKEELGEDYLDYTNIQDWTTVTHYLQFMSMFFESRKESNQFLNF